MKRLILTIETENVQTFLESTRRIDGLTILGQVPSPESKDFTDIGLEWNASDSDIFVLGQLYGVALGKKISIGLLDTMLPASPGSIRESREELEAAIKRHVQYLHEGRVGQEKELAFLWDIYRKKFRPDLPAYSDDEVNKLFVI